MALKVNTKNAKLVTIISSCLITGSDVCPDSHNRRYMYPVTTKEQYFWPNYAPFCTKQASYRNKASSTIALHHIFSTKKGEHLLRCEKGKANRIHHRLDSFAQQWIQVFPVHALRLSLFVLIQFTVALCLMRTCSDFPTLLSALLCS
jgi:hypothetical protein